MSSIARRRVAQKPRTCSWGRCGIWPGDVYLEHTVFPRDEVIDASRPTRVAECSACANRYGRGSLLAPPA